MLAYILALAVGFGSLSLYLSALLFPEIYRKYDLLWSGLGLFYALVLWVCAGRITGSLLLGQMASVALLGWLGWQTLSLRFAQTPVEQRMQLQGDSLQDALQGKFARLQVAFKDGAWRTYTADILERSPAQIADLARVFQGWIEALISTTLVSIMASPASTSPASTSPTSTSPTSTNTVPKSEESTAKQNSPSERLDTDIHIEIDRPFSPTPQTDLANSSELAAEWDDLEPEIYPELETIDSSGLDFESHPLRGQGTERQVRPRTSIERSDSH